MDGDARWYDHGECVESCALAGATAMIAGIDDSVMVANGPAWCYFYAMRVTDRPGLNLGQRFRCTYPSNGAVVFGTEKDILETLGHLKNFKPPMGLVLLENSCALSLIGDDIQGVAESAGLDCPIITFDSGGLLGDYWQGYTKALLEVLKKAKLTKEEPKEKLVNLIGLCPTYYNEENDVEELKRLLEMMGLKVNLALGMHHTMAEVSLLTKASLNIVIHPELGLEGAKWLEKHLAMPYIAPLLPYGLKGTRAWAQSIMEALHLEVTCLDPLFNLLAKEKEDIFERVKEMQRLCGEPWFDKVLLAGPGSILQGMEQVLLSEWLDCGEVLFVYHDVMNSYPAHYYSSQSHSWQEIIKKEDYSLILASEQEKNVVLHKKKVSGGYQTIANPEPPEIILSDRPFMGIRGNRFMLERIWNLYIQSLESGLRL